MHRAHSSLSFPGGKKAKYMRDAEKKQIPGALLAPTGPRHLGYFTYLAAASPITMAATRLQLQKSKTISISLSSFESAGFRCEQQVSN